MGTQIAFGTTVAGLAADAIVDPEGIIFRATLAGWWIIGVAVEAESVLMRFLFRPRFREIRIELLFKRILQARVLCLSSSTQIEYSFCMMFRSLRGAAEP